MASLLSGKPFGVQAALRFGTFFVLSIGAPLTLFALDRWNGNDDVSLAEAIRFTTGTPLGMLLLILLAASMIRPSWRRMRALALPGYLGLFLPIALIADLPFFLSNSPLAAFGKSFSWFDGRVPLFFLCAASASAALALARPGENPNSRPIRCVGIAAVVAGIWIVAFAIFFVGMARWSRAVSEALASDPESAPSTIFLSLTQPSNWAMAINPYVCLLFVTLIMGYALATRRTGG